MGAQFRKYTGLKLFREKILDNEKRYNALTPFSWKNQHDLWSLPKTNKLNCIQIQKRLEYSNISLKYHTIGGITDSITAYVGTLLIFAFYQKNPTVSFYCSIPTVLFTINAIKEWYTVFNQLEIKYRLKKIENHIRKKKK